MLYIDNDIYVDLECRGELIDGACAQDDVNIYVQGHESVTMTEELLAKVKAGVTKRTHGCYDLSAMTIKEKSDCEFDATCQFDALHTAPDFLPTRLLGEWKMVGHMTPEGANNVFKTYSSRVLFARDHHLEFAFSGQREYVTIIYFLHPHHINNL